MKRILCIILVLLLILSSCAVSRNGQKDTVTFYYVRTYSGSGTYDAYFDEGVIGSESREASGHWQDLSYLLAMYLQGPLDPELESPFPIGCKVTQIQHENGQLTLALSRMITVKNDMDLTIACACLAMTCLELEDVDTVQIESHGLDGKILFTRTFTRDNLLLEDTHPIETIEETP